MTYADDYHSQLSLALRRGDSEELAQIATTFYSRVGLNQFDRWKFSSVKVSRSGSWEAYVERWDKPKLLVSYERSLNRFWLDSSLVSDAELSEILQMPVAYFRGMCDAFACECVELQRAQFAIDKANRSRKKTLAAQKRARDKEKKLTSEAVVIQQVRKAKRESGKATERKIAAMQAELSLLQARLAAADYHPPSKPTDYPPPPPPASLPPTHHKNSSLPNRPGVYFVWSNNSIEYVGQSVRLAERATIKHENIGCNDYLSWLEFEEWRLDFAEAFYIGTQQPVRNFGSSAKVRLRA
jgi:hypothetical protein